MLPNASAQHRGKHYDLLLARELELIKREHEQNLITHKKLENLIRRDTNQIFNHNRNKKALPFGEIYNEQKETLDYHKIVIHTNNYANQKRNSSKGSSHNRPDEPYDEPSPEVLPKHRRFCSKGRRLPPIVKSNIPNRQKQSSKDVHWTTSVHQSNTQKENEPFTVLPADFLKGRLPELPPIQRQIHSFLETLPTYKGIQCGFDNFAPSSLYSYHASVAMR
jgi:hypothetical protein